MRGALFRVGLFVSVCDGLRQPPFLAGVSADLRATRPTAAAVTLPQQQQQPRTSAVPQTEWRDVFDRFDVDGDGALSFEEAVHFFHFIEPNAPTPDAQEHQIQKFHSYDLDGDGQLDFDEVETLLKHRLLMPVDSVLTQRERYSSQSLWLSSLRNFGRSTVLHAVMMPLLGSSCFALLVALVHLCYMSTGAKVGLPWAFGACLARGGVKMHSLLGGALSLLLVFRTNTAYGRFWEARKIWESLGNRCRELARFSFLYQDVFRPTGLELTAQMLIAFPAQLRRHLCGVVSTDDLPWQIDAPGWAVTFPSGTRRSKSLRGGVAAPNPLGPLPPALLQKLRRSHNRPLYLCRALGMLLRDLPDSDTFSSRERLKALDAVDKLGSYVGACERLVQTPVPLNYARHTSRFLTLWCLTLPLSLVADMGLLVVPVTAFVTWCLFGIQEIGLFIEHCALDHGAIFMDAAIEQITADIVEAVEPDEDGWVPPAMRQAHYSCS